MSSSASSSSSPEPPSPVPQKRKRKDVPIPVEDASNSNAADSDAEAEATSDEPVLSHAERRKRKKEEKRKANEAGNEEADSATTKKKRKLEDGKAIPVPAAKRKNSVWVGNMSFKTTQENLRTFFKDVGEIVRIYMPTKPGANPAMKPENRGFAYVDFATEDAKFVAISLSEQPLIGRKLLIKDGELLSYPYPLHISVINLGDDFTGRPAAPGADSAAAGSVTHSKSAQKILRAQKQPPAPTLFLGNLGFETTEQDIRQLLEAHRPKPAKKKAPAGEDPESESDEEKEKKTEKEKTDNKPKDVWLRKVRMGTFEDSGLCKGYRDLLMKFAFVDFTSIEHATASLINPKNHQLNGRKLVVEYAGAEAVRRGAPKAKREEGSAPFHNREGAPYSKRPERLERKPRQEASWFNDKAEEHVEQEHVPAAAGHRDHRAPEERNIFAGKEKREKGPRSRPKPGAALALAKRESAAILPSRGNKITF
ncbi:hypothetical protein H0H87_000748 [Tephrocybe sp. NHM501043]|nr:hypothetical protein H0H87_000748 [Tephrocybe sp. NHM501043]